MPSARQFLEQHGPTSLVSLGCGKHLDRIDNHVRLFLALGLTHYVGVDLEPTIIAKADWLFNNNPAMRSVLAAHNRDPDNFLAHVRLFPSTWVEELSGIHCGVIVCQRVLPFVHWEDLIVSMNPTLVLQEDLHGCELQILRDPRYQRNRAAIRHYGLQPFRPWRIMPGELNMILWQHRDHRPISGADQTGRKNKFGRLLRMIRPK
jgi:hypothetical protein